MNSNLHVCPFRCFAQFNSDLVECKHCQCTWHVCCCVISVSVAVWRFTKFCTEPIDVIAKWQIFLHCRTLRFPPFLSWQFQTFAIKELTLLFFSWKQSFNVVCFIIDLCSLLFTLTRYSSPQVKAICLSIIDFLVSEEAVSLPLGQTLIIILALTLDWHRMCQSVFKSPATSPDSWHCRPASLAQIPWLKTSS